MKDFKIGLQLYSVREDISADMDGTLKQIADMGYDCVEFAGYFDHSAEEVKAMCDKYGLEIPSVHQRHVVFLEDTENAVSFIKTLGVKYSAIPWASPDSWTNDYEKNMEEFTAASKILKENGIQLLYHNHDCEFKLTHNGKKIFDSMFEELGTDIIQPELDTCWAKYSGNDPIEYIKKFSDSAEVLHLKDFECKNVGADPAYNLIDDSGKTNEGRGDKEADGFEFRPVGYGRQNIPEILKTAENTNIKYLIVEQDEHPERSALEDAKLSIDYLRKIMA